MAITEAEIVLQILQRSDWRISLAEEEQAAAERLTAAYARTLPRIRQAQNDLVDALAMESENGEIITPSDIRGQVTYSRLLTTIEAEMNDFAVILRNEMSGLTETAIGVGAGGAADLAALLSGNSALISAAWVRPDPVSLRNIINYMDSDGMTAALRSFGENAARDISDLILTMAAQGKNPRFIARQMEDWNSVPYAWADNMARTVTIYSARTASHASYVANEDVLDGWMWVSAADDRTCISCWSKHGQIFTLQQILNDHHRGRCTAVPVVKGTTWRESFRSGPDLFQELPENTQRQIMGKSMHEAFTRGDVGWDEFSVPYENDIYGEMQRAATLKELTR